MSAGACEVAMVVDVGPEDVLEDRRKLLWGGKLKESEKRHTSSIEDEGMHQQRILDGNHVF